MDPFRLLHTLYIDAAHKKGVAETMGAKDIAKLYDMKNETGMTHSILPINDNKHAEETPRLKLLQGFRETERQIIDNVVPTPAVVEMPLSPYKIKTRIFSAAINQVVQVSPIHTFMLSAEIKSRPQLRPETVAIETDEPDYAGTNVVPLFPRALTIAS